ncbi:MAG: hypothetical protein V9G12_12995 [Microthrixaceae bacterium]
MATSTPASPPCSRSPSHTNRRWCPTRRTPPWRGRSSISVASSTCASSTRSRFHVQHRDLLDGATAWYRGDLYGAFNHVSTALADGRVEPPDTYFSRVFGRIGEMERLAHHISMLPSDASNRAAIRLRSGLAAAGA